MLRVHARRAWVANTQGPQRGQVRHARSRAVALDTVLSQADFRSRAEDRRVAKAIADYKSGKGESLIDPSARRTRRPPTTASVVPTTATSTSTSAATSATATSGGEGTDEKPGGLMGLFFTDETGYEGHVDGGEIEDAWGDWDVEGGDNSWADSAGEWKMRTSHTASMGDAFVFAEAMRTGVFPWQKDEEYVANRSDLDKRTIPTVYEAGGEEIAAQIRAVKAKKAKSSIADAVVPPQLKPKKGLGKAIPLVLKVTQGVDLSKTDEERKKAAARYSREKAVKSTA